MMTLTMNVHMIKTVMDPLTWIKLLIKPIVEPVMEQKAEDEEDSEQKERERKRDLRDSWTSYKSGTTCYSMISTCWAGKERR